MRMPVLDGQRQAALLAVAVRGLGGPGGGGQGRRPLALEHHLREAVGRERGREELRRVDVVDAVIVLRAHACTIPPPHQPRQR